MAAINDHAASVLQAVKAAGLTRLDVDFVVSVDQVTINDPKVYAPLDHGEGGNVYLSPSEHPHLDDELDVAEVKQAALALLHERYKGVHTAGGRLYADVESNRVWSENTWEQEPRTERSPLEVAL